MAERQPPPSSASSPAAGLSRKDDLKRKSGSQADADADADQAKKPKPAASRAGLCVIDDNPPWGKPVQEIEDPAAWRAGLPMIDDNPPWGKAVQVVEEPASSGYERPLGLCPGASPEERGGGSTRHQGTARGSVEEIDCWPPRKGARHISGEPQDIWLPRKHVRLDSDETDLEECGGARREQGDDAGSGFSPLRQRQRHQDTAMGSVEEIDCWPPRKGAHLIDETDSEESEDEMSTFAPQELLLDVKGAKALFRDKEDAYLKFVFRSRSKREGKVWHCVCKATNSPKPKLVFGLPKFHCACGSKFLQNNNLDFSLADVRVNFELVVSRIFDQKGPHCIANACCQAMLIMHTMDCITKKKEVKEAMVNINPEGLASSYSNKYPLMEPGVEIEKIPPSSIHKFIKMALMLKNNGIELEDGTFWRIGDISFIDKDNYEEICAELANGVPLLAVITPGVNFEYLKYCEVYRPPLLQDLHECNDLHEPKDKHQAHMVVLIGPAFKANGKNPGRSYYFVNSHANWCEREVYETYHEEAGDIKKPVHYGIGKIEEKGLVYSVIKLWKFGQTAGPGSVTLEDEDEGEAGKYENKIANKQKFTGQYRP